MDDELLKALSALLDEKLEPIKNDMILFKKQQEEIYQILQSLDLKAEHNKFSDEITHLINEIKNIRKDLSTIEIVTARNWANIAQLKIIK